MSDLSTVGILVIIAVIGVSTQYIAGAIARRIAARTRGSKTETK